MGVRIQICGDSLQHLRCVWSQTKWFFALFRTSLLFNIFKQLFMPHISYFAYYLQSILNSKSIFFIICGMQVGVKIQICSDSLQHLRCMWSRTKWFFALFHKLSLVNKIFMSHISYFTYIYLN